MKVILATIITCLLLFSASAATSWYLNQPDPTEETDSTEVESATTTTDDTETGDQAPAEENKVAAMPVSHRPKNDGSIESMLQMSQSLKQMEDRLNQRKLILQKEEQRVDAMYEDLRRERKELQAFGQNIDAKLAALNELTGEVKQMIADVEQREAKLATSQDGNSETASATSEVQNKVDKVKGWFANLEATQAAEYLKEFSNNGQLEFAAALIQKMPDRQKSKILSSLNDPVLVSQLIDSLKIPNRDDK